MNKSLSLSIFLIFSFISLSIQVNRIKQCKFSSSCILINTEVTVEVKFNIAPKKINLGELISNSNSTIKFSSEPKISRDKQSVLFTFTPSIPGKYHFKFNHNLNCNEVLTVKQPLKVQSMPLTLFISETYKEKEIKFPISFQFNDSISEQDVNYVELAEHVKKEIELNMTEPDYEKVKDCKINENDNTTLTCNIVRENKNEIYYILFYYNDRCYQRSSLGFLSFISIENENEDDNNGIILSLLTPLKGYNMKNYQSNQVTLITVVVSTENSKHLNYLQKEIAPIANKYPEYVFSFADWEQDKFIVKHYGLENDGTIKVIIIEFLTDNLFIGELTQNTNFTSLIESLKQRNIEWTSQSWLQKILSLFKLNLNKTEQNRLYFLLSSMAFVLLVVLRCYLYNRQRKKQEANFAVNDKKKKE